MRTPTFATGRAGCRRPRHISGRTAAYLVIAEAKAKLHSKTPAPSAVAPPDPSPKIRNGSEDPAPVRIVAKEVPHLTAKTEPWPEDAWFAQIQTLWEEDAEPPRPEQMHAPSVRNDGKSQDLTSSPAIRGK